MSEPQIDRRLVELHVMAARSRALKIFAFASTVYPQEWQGPFVEEIVMDLFEFGFHARRVNELCELGDVEYPPVDRFLVQFSVPINGILETDYRSALNRLVHARRFIFGNAHADHRQIFTASCANLTPTYVRITTDRREDASISLYGVADCFLSTAIPAIRERHPSMTF
jgi:hypothetical protein